MCVTNTHARLSLFITKLAANNKKIYKIICGVRISYLILNLQLPKIYDFFPVRTLVHEYMFMYPPKTTYSFFLLFYYLWYYAIVVSSCVV